MESNNINSIYRGTFEEFDALIIYNLGEFIAQRSDFSEEQPLIITAFEDKPLSPIEDLVCCGVAGGGGHAVRLSKLNINVFIFALKFLGADYGIYLKGGKDYFVCECISDKGKEIENFSADFEKHTESHSYKFGKISGYTGIIEKYLLNEKR